MSEHGRDPASRAGDLLAVLTKEFRIHLLNCSASGCLFECRSCFDVGTIASLRMVWQGEVVAENLQVVRCQQIEGAGSVYHVGAQFLWIDAPGSRSLREVMHRAAVQNLSLPPSSPV